MDAVAQVRELEARVAVGDDDGRLGRVEAGGPLGDAGVEGLDGRVVEGERDDEVDLSLRVVVSRRNVFFLFVLGFEVIKLGKGRKGVLLTMIFILGFAARMICTILV